MAINNSLEGFLSKVRDAGLAVSSHYYVTFSDPGDNSDVTMLVDSVTMPGVTILSNEIRTFGEVIEMPYGIAYAPITLTVIVTNKAEALAYFHNWANRVFNRETRYQNFKKGFSYYASPEAKDSGDLTTLPPFVKEVSIVLQDREHGDVYRIRLEEAYPKSIADISLDYANHDVVKISVTLNYSRWVMDERFDENTDQRSFAAYEAATRLEDIQTAAMVALSDRRQALYNWDNPNAIGTNLQQYGSAMGASIGRASSSVQAALRGKTLIGADGTDQSSSLQKSLSNLTSNFVNFGEGLKDLGRNLNDVVAPVRAISGAVSSVSSTLGSIDNTMKALGLGTPFAKIRGNLNSTAGTLYNVGLLNGVPGHLGTIGANMNGIGTQFRNVSTSIQKSSNATDKMSASMDKLGNVFQRQGSNTINGSNNLQSYSDTHP